MLAKEIEAMLRSPHLPEQVEETNKHGNYVHGSRAGPPAQASCPVTSVEDPGFRPLECQRLSGPAEELEIVDLDTQSLWREASPSNDKELSQQQQHAYESMLAARRAKNAWQEVERQIPLDAIHDFSYRTGEPISSSSDYSGTANHQSTHPQSRALQPSNQIVSSHTTLGSTVEGTSSKSRPNSTHTEKENQSILYNAQSDLYEDGRVSYQIPNHRRFQKFKEPDPQQLQSWCRPSWWG